METIYPYEGEIINKVWYIKKVKYYTTIARKGLLIHATTWNNVRNVERKKNRLKDYILYDSTQIKFKNSQKLIYGHRNQKVVATKEGDIDWKDIQGNFLG